jgi:hypothetical protein
LRISGSSAAISNHSMKEKQGSGREAGRDDDVVRRYLTKGRQLTVRRNAEGEVLPEGVEMPSWSGEGHRSLGYSFGQDSGHVVGADAWAGYPRSIGRPA